MRHLTAFVALFAVVTSSFAFVDSADARSLTEITRKQAQRTHALAARLTASASSFQSMLPAKTTAFNAAMASSNYNTKFYGKRAYLSYLQKLKSKIMEADRVHYSAIHAWAAYGRASRNFAVATANANALNAARAGFASTINAINARMAVARAA